MTDLDINSIVKQRQRELRQCDALVEAVQAFILEHISDHGPDVRPSDAFSIVAMGLRRAAERSSGKDAA